jgi:acetyl-CoA acetyltransferase
VTQYQSFNGAPWPLAEIGLTHVAGPMISQVCATGAGVLLAPATEFQLGMSTIALALTADRISNGPHLYYPLPGGPGGTGQSEDQMLFNFSNDPLGGHSMPTPLRRSGDGATSGSMRDFVIGISKARLNG